MKRTQTGSSKESRKSSGHVRWDEDNLEENEKIKKDLNPRKINEPKTPYLSPMHTDDEFDVDNGGVFPLSLEDEPRPSAVGPTGWSDSDRSQAASPRVACHKSSSNSEGPVIGSLGKSPSRSPARFSSEYYSGQDSDEDLNSNPERLEKRRKFMELRKQHYHMRMTLQEAKDLLQDEDEDGEPKAQINGNFH